LDNDNAADDDFVGLTVAEDCLIADDDDDVVVVALLFVVVAAVGCWFEATTFLLLSDVETVLGTATPI
jgi:hypothetical protein